MDQHVYKYKRETKKILGQENCKIKKKEIKLMKLNMTSNYDISNFF